MQRSIFLKTVAVGFLVLLLMIPLSMIDGMVNERMGRRDQVRKEIARSDAGEQMLAGPVLALPYTVLTPVERTVDGQVQRSIERREGTHYVLPEQLDIEGAVDTEQRGLGLFKALLYNASLRLHGHFQLANGAGLPLQAGESVLWGAPQLLLGVADPRGIRNVPQLSWNGRSLSFAPGQPLALLGGGLHARLPEGAGAGGRFEFALDLHLRGNTELQWLPMGATTRVSLRSPWQHPRFNGDALPRKHSISSQGFVAQWETSHFASDMPQRFARALNRAESSLHTAGQGVSLVQPVDIYQQAERSVKYGFLFVLLTFAAFALFELLKDLRIHPVQYGLVGIALALFFLLLLALSEHMPFGLSYLLASGGCVGLLTFYLSHVLQSLARGAGFAALLVLLYGALYGLLVSEDNALLMGSLLLFVLLAVVMVLTRRVNWYALGTGPESCAPTVAELAATGGRHA